MALVKVGFPLGLLAILALLVLAMMPHPQIAAPSLELPAVQMAKDPGTISQPVPLPQVPPIPEHLRNHPRGAYTAALKVALWTTAWNAWFNGKGPDWCGKRPSDGAVILAWYTLEVVKTTGGAAYHGIGLLLNQGGANQSTTFPNVFQNSSGLPDTGNSGGNDYEQFDPFPCPDPTNTGSLITQ